MVNITPADWRNTDELDDDLDTFDLPPANVTPSFFDNDKSRQPQPRIAVSLQVEADVLRWFRSQGPGWEKRMMVALRLYMEAHLGDEPVE
jgi:uncharacterized protein (DUF4415 family)